MQQQFFTAVTNIYIYILKYYILKKECLLSTVLSSPFSPCGCARIIIQSLLLSCRVFDPVASHWDKDVQVEAVIRLPEEEDEHEAEEAGAGETPVQPRRLWIKEKERERETCLG